MYMYTVVRLADRNRFLTRYNHSLFKVYISTVQYNLVYTYFVWIVEKLCTDRCMGTYEVREEVINYAQISTRIIIYSVSFRDFLVNQSVGHEINQRENVRTVIFLRFR